MPKSPIDPNLVLSVGDKLGDRMVESARQSIANVNVGIVDAQERAAEVAGRTEGTAFEAFGKNRVDVANDLAADPEYPVLDEIVHNVALTVGGVLAVKVGAVALVGLGAYGLYKMLSESEEES